MKKIINFISSIPKDKLLHAYAGTIVVIVSMSIFSSIGLTWHDTVGFALLITTMVGCGKELYDINNNGYVETSDFIATLGGGLIGAIISIPMIL